MITLFCYESMLQCDDFNIIMVISGILQRTLLTSYGSPWAVRWFFVGRSLSPVPSFNPVSTSRNGSSMELNILDHFKNTEEFRGTTVTKHSKKQSEKVDITVPSLLIILAVGAGFLLGKSAKQWFTHPYYSSSPFFVIAHTPYTLIQRKRAKLSCVSLLSYTGIKYGI